MCFFVCFNVTAITEIYTYLHTLSLHDALPIFAALPRAVGVQQPIIGQVLRSRNVARRDLRTRISFIAREPSRAACVEYLFRPRCDIRSEEHTSELQSLMRISYAVFCLQKKKTDNTTTTSKLQPHTSRKN